MSQNAKSQIVRLVAGNLGQPGAPILHMDLLYNPELGTMNGACQISQSVTPPGGHDIIPHVTGEVHGLGMGGATRVFSLSGQYVKSVPPPAIGSYLAEFKATFVTDNNWKGHGTFSYGPNQTITNVPVGPAE